ncbi:B3 domain-containing protein Os03g0212300-like [Hordeum vulgare subsp. vulgare]|uniref:B3 domain-containing protein Os03g0212300-like n=1 Tax=Hordeum vulgare subsp. vulgare TaxID=112509 RepID=UPI000B47B5C5|nr:B3 domain-containing protein Os03g0212300-like [Hordeum vulgare subsp. vulgare]
MLDDREPPKVKLWESGSGHHRLWDVLVVFDTNGHMYLWCEWEHFSRAHDLQLGHLLVFRYDGELVLTAKVFDGTMCRRHYQHDDDPSNGSYSGDEEEQSEEEEE